MIINVDDRPPSPDAALPEYASDMHSARMSDNNLPPSYIDIPRPSQPMTYTFTDWTSGSTLLMPPPTASDLSPLYHISVELNLHPFLPLSYVTTIRKRNLQGPLVGSFDLAVHHKREIITMGDSTTRLSNVLLGINGSSRHWKWACGDVGLRWDCRSLLDDGSPLCICYDMSEMSQLASFVPPPLSASPPLPAAILTVFPDGHQFFDHILISALIIERKRTLDF